MKDTEKTDNDFVVEDLQITIDYATIKNYQLLSYIERIFRRKSIKAYLDKYKAEN